MRNNRWRFVRPLRRIVQWFVVVLFCALPWLNMHEWTRIYGSLFALDVYGIPFSDPVSVFWPMVHGEFPIRLWGGLGLTLVLALLLGRFFCGWLCPYGLLSEYAHTVNAALQRLWERFTTPNEHADEHAQEPANARATAESADTSFAPSPESLAGPDKGTDSGLSAFWVRVLVLGLVVGASMVFVRSLLQWLSMPGALSLLPIYAWYGGTIAWGAIGLTLLLPFGVLLLEVLTGVRLWCKWLCPQAVLLSLAALVGRPFLHVRWDAQFCKCPGGHRPCAKACSLALRSRQRGGPSRGECVQCFACVAACKCKGTGALRAGLPAGKAASQPDN